MKIESNFMARFVKNARVFVVAEAGVNHNGSLTRAKKLVDEAARIGADAVKFQTFQASLLASATAGKAPYQVVHSGRKESQREMLSKLELTEGDHRELFHHCRQRGILFLSTPFDWVSADLLDRLNVPAFKISSGDLTNYPFLAHVAKKGKPLILSTGMANLAEIRKAVQTIRRTRNTKLILLHCVSAYPADPGDMNLRAMDTLRRTFHVTVGLSDHTPGGLVPVVATAMGAAIIEKHFTLNQKLAGPDHSFSLTPAQFQKMIEDIRLTEATRGSGVKRPVSAEAPIAAVSRKSLFSARPLKKGEKLDASSVAILRPGTGLPPSALPFLTGRIVRRSIGVGQPLTRGMFR